MVKTSFRIKQKMNLGSTRTETRTRLLQRVLCSTFLCAQIGLLCGFTTPVAAQSSEEKAQVVESETYKQIVYRPLEEAITRGVRERKNTIIVFGAEWCSWCKKMESSTLTDPQVLALAGSYMWTKVDIDKQTRIASFFEIRGVPVTAVVNARGEVLTVISGYMPVSSMVTLLEKYKNDPFAKSEMEKRIDQIVGVMRDLDNSLPDKEFDVAVVKLVEVLAGMDMLGRKAMVIQVKSAGDRVLPALVKLLESKRLATRAAAVDLLKDMTRADIAFDPFAEQDVRAAQIEGWKKYLQDKQMRLSDVDFETVEKEIDRVDEQKKKEAEEAKKPKAPAAPI
ncbi:thioredoxin family protein [Planctomycetota bacterium]|nr:thioredoxin family protein [Planctomycetota bacterium]